MVLHNIDRGSKCIAEGLLTNSRISWNLGFSCFDFVIHEYVYIHFLPLNTLQKYHW
jgi:hypothetical protein